MRCKCLWLQDGKFTAPYVSRVAISAVNEKYIWFMKFVSWAIEWRYLGSQCLLKWRGDCKECHLNLMSWRFQPVWRFRQSCQYNKHSVTPVPMLTCFDDPWTLCLIEVHLFRKAKVVPSFLQSFWSMKSIVSLFGSQPTPRIDPSCSVTHTSVRNKLFRSWADARPAGTNHSLLSSCK